MSKNLNNSLIKEEEKNDDDNQQFIENILSENSALLKESKSNCCKCNICTKIPLFLCFFIIASLFLIILLGLFLTVGILLMESLYKEINDSYFTNFVIDPIINKKTNSTQAFNIKNEVFDNLYLESKLSNLQISIEFILDNLKNENNINNMTKHNTTNNNFKCLRRSNKNALCGSSNDTTENESNYFIYLNENSDDYDDEYENLFSSLTHYMKLFESNLEFYIFDDKFINIKEMFVYLEKRIKRINESDDIINNNKTLLTYCYNWDKENGLIENIYNSQAFNDIINKTNIKRFDKEGINDTSVDIEESNNFRDYLVNNDFDLEKTNQLNYLKLKVFNYTIEREDGNKTYDFILGIRLDNNSITNILNKQNSNMTSIAPITNFISSDSSTNEGSSELHLLYNNKYFYDFFEYGLKNTISQNNIKIMEEYAEQLEKENTNIKTFFNLLNYARPNEYDETMEYLYNLLWKDDFIAISRLIYKIIGNYDLPQVNCDNKEEEQKNILCQIYKNIDNLESEIVFSDIKNLEDDVVIEDLNKTSVLIHEKLKNINRTTIYYSLVQNAFTDLIEINSNTKIVFYNSSVNNIFFNNIEILNVKIYNSLKEDFIEEMKEIENIIVLIRIGLIFIFLIISLIQIIREVSMAINRINLIISLKDMLFNKTEVKIDEDKEEIDTLLNNDKDNELEFDKDNNEQSLSDKDDNETANKTLYESGLESEKERINKLREKWSKNHFYDNNYLSEGNKLITQYTYNKLKNIFENRDFYQNEKFSEKIVFLKRRYKLNEQYEDKDDCELSSDIYQAISKISMINMDDIYYNVYYNQSYVLNQSFKMFKCILDNSINKQSIPLRNNKYINFGRILKFIYYIKKEKIQKIIEVIYGKDLKYKNKDDDKKNSDVETVKILSPNKSNKPILSTKSHIFTD